MSQRFFLANNIIEDARPTSPTEDVVAAAWALALRRPTVNRDADFRTLGVNANRALRLMREIWLSTGRELPINALFEMPTVRRMATAIDDGSAFIAPDLVQLRAGDSSPPLFFFGGGGGYLVDLIDLAAAVDTAAPIYGIPASGMDGRGRIYDRYEAEAAYALGVIRRVQPRGPYRLLGYSNGGLAALETARLASQNGDDIAFLGMLDTGIDDKYWPLPVWLGFIGRKCAAKLAVTTRGTVRSKPEHAASKAPVYREPAFNPKRRGSQLTYRFRNPKAPGYPYYSPYWESHHTPQYSLVREAAARMKGYYKPSVYDNKVSFFLASKADKLTVPPHLLWPRYLPNAEWITLPGSHLTIILRRHVAHLAKEISNRL